MERERREIASLTKIMTCFLVLRLVKKFGIDDRKHYVCVSDAAASVPGTSAELKMGD
jgi:D-alanyl-D-alanine carboxypeptidase